MASEQPEELSAPFSTYEVVAWDLETTGFGSYARIVQIGAVSASGKKFETLVNPLCRIPETASRVHGIYDRSVEGKPSFPKAWTDFMRFLREVHEGIGSPKPLLLVGHNSRGFDESIVRGELALHGLLNSPDHAVPPGTRSADTLLAFKAAKARQHVFCNVSGERVELDKLNLPLLCETLLLDKDLAKNAHDALADSTVVLQLLRKTEGLVPFLTLFDWLEAPTQAPRKRTFSSSSSSSRPAQLARTSQAAGLAATPYQGTSRSEQEDAPLPSTPQEGASSSGPQERPLASTVNDRALLVCNSCLLPFSWAAPHFCSESRGALGADTGPRHQAFLLDSLDSLRYLGETQRERREGEQEASDLVVPSEELRTGPRSRPAYDAARKTGPAVTCQ